jgi:hypothetical protein
LSIFIGFYFVEVINKISTRTQLVFQLIKKEREINNKLIIITTLPITGLSMPIKPSLKTIRINNFHYYFFIFHKHVLYSGRLNHMNKVIS